MKKGVPKEKIALELKITRMELWKIEQRFKKWGEEGLRDHSPGRLFEPLSPKFYDLVVNEWKRYKCGARKLHALFGRQGYGVSRRKIEQVLIEKGFQKPFPKRKKPRIQPFHQSWTGGVNHNNPSFSRN